MQFETTAKLFYGKFPYKAVMEKEAFDMDEYYKDMRQMLQWLRSISKEDQQMRHARTIQLFFKKRKDLEHVINKYGKWVTKVYEPYNKKHYEYLITNKDTITRNKMFWNRYPYKITFGAHTSMERSIDWFNNFFTEKDPNRYRSPGYKIVAGSFRLSCTFYSPKDTIRPIQCYKN